MSSLSPEQREAIRAARGTYRRTVIDREKQSHRDGNVRHLPAVSPTEPQDPLVELVLHELTPEERRLARLARRIEFPGAA